MEDLIYKQEVASGFSDDAEELFFYLNKKNKKDLTDSTE